MDGGHERRELLGVPVISCEQDHTPDQGVLQDLDVFGGELGARHIDHEGSECHGWARLIISDARPAGSSTASDST